MKSALILAIIVFALLIDESTRGLMLLILALLCIPLVMLYIVYIAINNVPQSKSVDEELARIFNMDGLAFERYAASLLSKNGYRTTVTQGSGDFGADVIASKDGSKYVVQCKKYAQNVGIKAVQEIYAAKVHYKADYAVVLTNAYFTPAAQKLAGETNVILWDRNVLREMIAATIKPSPKKEEAKPDRSNNHIGRTVSFCCIILLFVVLIAAPFIYYNSATNSDRASVTETPFTTTVQTSTPKTTQRTSASTFAPVPTASPVPMQARILRGVNVRADATADSEKVGSLKQGETVIVTQAYYKPKWHQILYKDELRYVSANFTEILGVPALMPIETAFPDLPTPNPS